MVKIRLARRGRKSYALYDVVVADARAPRDGRYIEKIGTYNPNTDPATIELNDEKAFQWVMDGAQPTDTVRAMLSYRGIMMKKHLQVGVLKGAITQEEADKRFAEWKESKEQKIQEKIDRLAKERDDIAKNRKAAETKVREARAEVLQQKQKDLEAAAIAAAKEAAGEEEEEAEVEAVAETPAVEEAPAQEEVKAEEPKAEETKTEEPVEAPEAKEEAPAEEPVKAEAEAEVEAAPAETETEAPAKEEEVKAEEAKVEEPKAEAPAEEEKKSEEPKAESSEEEESK